MAHRALLPLLFLLAACDLSGITTKPRKPDIVLGPNPLYVFPGGSGYLSLSIPKGTGLSGEVSLTLEGTPPGVTLFPQTVSVGEEGGFFTLTLSVGEDVTPGEYALTFVAATQNVRKTAPLDLIVRDTKEVTIEVDTTEDTHDADPNDGKCQDSSGHCSLRAALEHAGTLPLEENAFLRVKIILPEGEYGLTESLGLDFTEGVEVVLEGAGQERTVLDGQGSVRLLQVSRGTKATVKGMTLRGGLAQAEGGEPPPDEEAPSNLPFAGGAIHNAGELTLKSVRIEGSKAAYGGAIYNNGLLIVEASLIRANTATMMDEEARTCQKGCGGGLYNDGYGTAFLTDTTLEENEAGRGGALYTAGLLALKEVTLRNNRAEDGAGAYVGTYILEEGQSGTLTAEDSTFEENQAQGKGGAIYSGGTVSLKTTALVGNQAAYGGGIYSTGLLETYRSNLLSNAAQEGAGAYSTGESALKASSVVGSTGSGIYNAGKLTLVNATTSRNTTGIRSAGPSLALSFSTIADGLNVLSGEATLKGVALAGACQGQMASAGWNLFQSPGCQVTLQETDRTGDPLLEPLTEDRGVWVHRPMADSPLIDGVSPASCTDLSGAPVDEDARGVARPKNSACDIGAVEY